MDIQNIFEKFMDKAVNLNTDRVNRIKEAKRILAGFIKNQDDFKDLYVETTPQGSFRQKTITKPIGDDGTFDVDLLVKLKDNLDWSPADYHSKLATAFKDSGRYKDITDTKGKTRCVTIDYEGDFHVDLVPAIERSGEYFICNKATDKPEKTDGDGYAQWFEQQDAIANGHLVPAVRLIKYLRDSKGEFDTKSIILTTIAGMQIHPDGNFSDLPNTLSTILTQMNEFLSQFDKAPSIPNPAMPGENFDRHWKDEKEKFNKLKVAIEAYADIADNAISTTSDEERVEHWQELFGDEFSAGNEDGKGVVSPSDIPRPPAPGPVTPPMPPRRREVGQ